MKIKTLLTATAVLAIIVSCGSRGGGKSPKARTAPEEGTCLDAVSEYLTGTIAKGYSPAKESISYWSYCEVDDSDKNDIRVWGDFHVENYDIVGDTLMFVSGGNHPGEMHLKQDTEGKFTVTGFDPVADGSNFLPSAKKIFGDRFDAFQASNSDHIRREEVRKGAIANYVSKRGLPVKVYKDYGWPAVEIPRGK